MITAHIHIDNKMRSVQVPENWEELTDKQLANVAHTLFMQIGEARMDVRLAVILLGLKYNELRKTEPEVMSESILPMVQWVKTECDLTEQKIPVVGSRFSLVKYYGPSSALLNLRFCEWDAAERALYTWHQSNELADLYRFCAVLYRPKRRTAYSETDDVSDPRAAYNYSKTESIAQALQKIMPLRIAYSIALWYKGCRHHINKLYPTIFQAPDVELGEDDEDMGPHFFPLMRSIAKTGIYGDIDKVEQLYLYTTLEEMVAAEQDREAAERAMKTNKTEYA